MITVLVSLVFNLIAYCCSLLSVMEFVDICIPQLVGGVFQFGMYLMLRKYVSSSSETVSLLYNCL